MESSPLTWIVWMLYCGIILPACGIRLLRDWAIVCKMYRELELVRMQVEREMMREAGDDDVMLIAVFEAFDTFSAEHPMPKPPMGYRLWLRTHREV